MLFLPSLVFLLFADLPSSTSFVLSWAFSKWKSFSFFFTSFLLLISRMLARNILRSHFTFALDSFCGHTGSTTSESLTTEIKPTSSQWTKTWEPDGVYKCDHIHFLTKLPWVKVGLLTNNAGGKHSMRRHLYQNTWKEEPANKLNNVLNRVDNLLNRVYDILNRAHDLLNGR